ncbi:WD-40 repeat-containing protein MSI2-like [Curcuma longa]|uniref:WD-40 repeat-containing protein MSI2-like n=1 Tax=Curcuma longa TaxID=136217 RepID=UPI003D9DDAF8
MKAKKAAERDKAKEDYRLWKVSTPFLYDLVISHPLKWPSLTVRWLPCSSPSSSSGSSPGGATHRLLLGTNTSGYAPNSLMIADVLFPLPPEAPPGAPLPKVEISQTIPHQGEVKRARFMPQRPSVVATMTRGSEVHVFDCERRPLKPVEGEESGPDVVLSGLSKEGYGISWSPHKEGFLLSGSYDSKICLWDVGMMPEEKVLDARYMFEAHTDSVKDVAWHLKNENMFGSVGNDHLLMIWDLRSSASGKPQQSLKAHENKVNSLSFNPFNEWLLATASEDSTVNLFDLRKLTTSLHTCSGHVGSVAQVEWSPRHETIFASSAADKRLIIWDLNRIGDEQTADDAVYGPPEAFFVHAGHTAKISEFSWNPEEPWVIASMAEDNILQVWQMAESYQDVGGNDR